MLFAPGNREGAFDAQAWGVLSDREIANVTAFIRTLAVLAKNAKV